MKLFLLNTIENQESSKIGLVFLVFFYNFLGISWVHKKKKKKRRYMIGLKLAWVGPHAGESAPARVRGGGFAEVSLPVQKSEWQPSALFTHLTDTCRNTLAFPPLHNPQSMTANDRETSSGEPTPADSRNDRCSTSAQS
jgi:hypothetical protein